MIRQACRADYRTLCADVTPGRGARLKCLRDNAASLSAECRQALAATIQGAPAQSAAPPAAPQPPAAGTLEAAPPVAVSPREELLLLRSACGADFRTYCRGLPLGGGRIIGCLRDNAASLSPRCQRALAALRGAR
jgi:cysteine rich repeat protein